MSIIGYGVAALMVYLIGRKIYKAAKSVNRNNTI